MNQSPQSWTRTAVWLHAIMLFLFAMMFFLAYTWDFAHGATKHAMIDFHKSVGVAIVMVAVVRLFWMLTHKGPRPIGTVSQQKAALGVHHLLYLLMFLMPLSGYFMVMMHGKPISFFGLFDLPVLFQAHPALKELSEDVHTVLADIVLVLVGGHAALALYHHIVLKDETLRRMNPFS